MFTGLIAVSVANYQGQNDKNGKSPIFLNILGGKAPNKILVQSGTIAENQGLEVGKSYLLQVRELEPDAYGRRFSFSKAGTLSALEIIQAESMLGKAEVFDATKVETSTGVTKDQLATTN